MTQELKRQRIKSIVEQTAEKPTTRAWTIYLSALALGLLGLAVGYALG